MTTQRGMALVVTLLAMVLLSALGTALVLATSVESMIAANFRNATEARYALDSLASYAIADLKREATWNPAITGAARSGFADGLPSGVRRLADGTTIDIDAIVNRATCGRATRCSAADLVRVTAERPWGANNPRWVPYAYGPLRNVPGASAASFYGVAMVGDDPAENDGNPLADGVPPGNAGAGIVRLRVEVFGPRGTRRAAVWSLARRTGAGGAGAGEGIDAPVLVVGWRRLS